MRVTVIMEIREGNCYLFVTKATRVVMAKDSKDYFKFNFNLITHFVDLLDLDLFMLAIINTEKVMGSSYHIDFLTLKPKGLEDEGS